MDFIIFETKCFFGKEKYQSRLNAVRERVLWRLLRIHFASATDSSSMGLNRPSQSCQNVSSLVCTFSFTYASCTHPARKVCVVWQNLASFERQCVPRSARLPPPSPITLVCGGARCMAQTTAEGRTLPTGSRDECAALSLSLSHPVCL